MDKYLTIDTVVKNIAYENKRKARKTLLFRSNIRRCIKSFIKVNNQ
jgi:hypothetical protein